jgi:predicted DNA-binding transcriptional regulator YafY
MRLASRPPLRRLLALDQQVRAGEYPNARTLARELEVHERTVHRDLDFLRTEFHAPLAYCPRRNGYYYTEPGYALPLVKWSEAELVALFLAGRALEQYRGTPLGEVLAGAVRKLTLHLPDEVTVSLEHLREAYSVRGPVSTQGEVATFRRLMRAVQQGRRLELVYWSASRDEETKRVVDPYHLTCAGGEWYLVGYCHLREGVRMFAPGRVRSLRETGEVFERPADFRIEEYLDGSFRALRGEGRPRRVRLVFNAEAARWVREKQWHPSQKVRELRGGALELTLKVSHLGEVRAWVLSYGSKVEVKEPEELRREVAEELRAALGQYGGK